MDEHICVPPDGRGEVRVEGSSEAVMVKLAGIEIGTAEVGGLIHASGGHDPDQFVEELIVYSLHQVQTIRQVPGGLIPEVVPKLTHDLLEGLQVVHLGRGMASQDAEGGEPLVDLLCDCDVREEHEFFDEVVGLDHFVHLYISCGVGLFLEGYFDLRGGQGQGALLYSFLLELLGDPVEVSDGLGDGALVVRVHQLLRLTVGEGPSGSDDGLAVLGVDDVGLVVYLPNGRKGQPVDI